jgi:hypothetical protein
VAARGVGSPHSIKEAAMAVAFIQEFTIDDDDRSTTNYDSVAEQLAVEGNLPEGLVVHTAGFDEEGRVFRIFDVWESREQAERFQQERLMPIVEKMMAERPDAAPPSRQGFYDLHDLNRT